MKVLKVGIVGCGAMGSEIARACRKRLRRAVALAGLCDIDEAKAKKLAGSLKHVRVMKLDELVKHSGLVVEAAGGSISAGILARCIAARKDCLIMSVGGLLGKEPLLRKAEGAGVRVYIPSGALAGIDALKAAAVGRIDTVTLTTRKPPKGLEGAPYLAKKGMSLAGITGELTVFEGSAREAVGAFPANINVSAVLSLAGIGARRTRVRIVTSPLYTRNTHEVEVTGDFGKITAKTENLPSSANPKTSALAIYSAIATLEAVAKRVRLGT